MGRALNLADLANEDVMEAPVPAIVLGSAPVNRVAAFPINPRSSVGNIDSLAESFKQVGQLQSITVVHTHLYLEQFPEHADLVGTSDYVAITGGRRRAAVVKLGWSKIDITIKDQLAESRSKLRAAALAENIDRADLDLVDQAQGVKDLVGEYRGRDAKAAQAEAGRELGKSQQWVSQMCNLLRLTAELQALVREGTISFRVARKLSSLPPDEQMPAWLAEAKASAPSEEDAPEDGAELGNTAVLPRQKERVSPVLRAIRRLGPTPTDMAAALRAHLQEDERRALAEALLADDE